MSDLLNILRRTPDPSIHEWEWAYKGARQAAVKEIERLEAEVSDLRQALAEIRSQRDHWHRLVPISDRVKNPFQPEST